MSKKAEEAALIEQLLRVLGEQRSSGGSAYPPTLRRLGELCGGTQSEAQLVKAANSKAFKATAAVPEKVNKKPSLDSPVYFIEDVPPKPKPQRKTAPRKINQVAELANRMVLVLESQRRLGGEVYPPTLRRLAELCDRMPSDPNVTKAASHEAMTARAVVTAKARGKPHLEAPVVLKEDLAHGVSTILPALLKFALAPITSKAKGKTVETNAFPPADLAKKLIPDLKEPLTEALTRAIERRDLSDGVAWVTVKGKPLLFLAASLGPRAERTAEATDGKAASALTSTSTRPATGFPEAFREAFDRLDRRNGATNFVKLVDLRRALAEFTREEFDAALAELRRQKQFALDSHEGLHGPLTPEEREAGVREAGSLLVYASRR